jgi:hypothetical protein
MHPSKTIKKYASLNELARQFFEQPGLTPAAAALIVNGVLPMPGCTTIPEQGVLLEDQLTPATSRDFRLAKSMLKYWVESELSDEGLEDPLDDAHLQRILEKETTFINFLIWCDGDDPGPQSFRPRLYDYFLGLIRDPARSETLLPAPVDVIDRANALEHHVAIQQELSSTSRVPLIGSEQGQGAPGDEPPSVRTVRPNGTGKRETAIAPKIREVQKTLPEDQRRSVVVVWAALNALAETGKDAVLRSVSEKGIVYRGTDRDRVYTRDALSKHLSKKS